MQYSRILCQIRIIVGFDVKLLSISVEHFIGIPASLQTQHSLITYNKLSSSITNHPAISMAICYVYLGYPVTLWFLPPPASEEV